jgi:hypothetical protein
MRSVYCKRNFGLWIGAILPFACAVLAGQSALAQPSAASWADQSYQRIRPERVSFPGLATVLKRGTFEGDEETAFSDYFNKAIFPHVTNEAMRQTPPNDVILRLRSSFRECEKAQDKQVFDKLAELTMAFMTKIAKDPQCHPVARMNAMLAIGEINSPDAVKALQAASADNAQNEAVRVAAMSGLIRLASLPQGPMSSSSVALPVVAWMVKIVGAKIPKTPRADFIRWMRGQAADVLAALKGVGPDAPSALLVMLNDKDLPIPLRCKAAKALGSLNYGNSLPAATPYLLGLAELARGALDIDQPADRGRVRLVIRDVLDGLNPFASSTLSNDQNLIEGLKNALKALEKETETRQTDTQLKESIKKAKDALDSLLKKRTAG